MKARIRCAAEIAAGAMTWTGLCLDSEIMMGIGAMLALLAVGSKEPLAWKGGESHV